MEIIQMELSIRDRKIIVDDDMGDKIKEHTWYIQEFPKSETLVITTRIDRKIVRLENFIYGEKGVSQIKKNNDYRRSNLTPHFKHTRVKRKGTTSKYKGVSFHKATKRYQARITINGKLHFLGYFPDAESAGLAYNDAVDELLDGRAIKNDIVREDDGEPDSEE